MSTRELPDKVKQLDVLVGQDIAGSLVKDSIYNFSYAEALLETLQKHKTDTRIPDGLLAQLGVAWKKGMPSRKRGTS